MKARSFSHVGITVANFNRFVQFYWDVFGCPLVGVSDTPPDRVRAFFNTCPHRGAMVCREKHGNEKMFRCFYHAWAFDLQGKLVNRPGTERYAEGSNADGVAPPETVNEAHALVASWRDATRPWPCGGACGAR